MGPTLNLRGAAKALAISEPGLLKAHRTGRVPRNEDGTFDVDACRQAFTERTNPKKQHAEMVVDPVPAKRRKADPGSYSEAVRRREWLKVEKEEVEQRLREGKALDADDVAESQQSVAWRVRDFYLNLAARHSAIIASHAGGDERKTYLALDKAAKQALRDLSVLLGGEAGNADAA